MPATLAQVADPAQLAVAWADVLASDQEDGVRGHGVARFAEDADESLARIADELRSGTYEPGQLAPVRLPRPDGRIRLLHVPAVRDRVVERSILAVLAPGSTRCWGRSATPTGQGSGWRTPPRPSPGCGTRD